MLQLYKIRNFSALINDTFSFFRQYGKNYFKNYIILNGGLLLILIVMCFILGKVFFENIFSGISSPESTEMLEVYFADNKGFFIAAGVVTLLLSLLITIINYSYPIIYLSEAEKHERPQLSQIMASFKAKLGRIIIFGLLFLVTFVPIAIVIALFSMLMIVIIIGIPVALILFAAFSCWTYLSFYDFLNTDNGYFTSMKKGWFMLFQNFWNHTGSTAIFYIIIYIVQGILTFIPYMISIFMMISNTRDAAGGQENLSVAGILMLISFILYIILAFFLANILMINQGMIYYSCREKKENQSMHNSIDLIGTDFE